MAAPAGMTSQNMSGKFVLNPSLSEKSDEILKVQGVGWAKRKAMGMIAPHVTIKHYTDDSNVEHMEIQQSVSDTRKNEEHRVLNWSELKRENPIFGPTVVMSRRVQLAELGAEWLKKGWLPESFVGGAIVYHLVKAEGDTAWSMEQTWGFEMIGGSKRYVRRVYLSGPKGEVVEGRMVYDFEGAL